MRSILLNQYNIFLFLLMLFQYVTGVTYISGLAIRKSN